MNGIDNFIQVSEYIREVIKRETGHDITEPRFRQGELKSVFYNFKPGSPYVHDTQADWIYIFQQEGRTHYAGSITPDIRLITRELISYVK